MELIDNQIINRISKAIKCLGFNKKFYSDINEFGFTAEEVFKMKAEYLVSGFKWFKNPDHLEETFRWLIKIGVLRREVDGQGLTSKVRLTPLGRQLLQQRPLLPIQKASLFEKVSDWFFRKLFF